MFKISERHWAWLGRVAILVTILGGPTILLGYCHHNPSASLIAKVEYGAFSLPDDIEQADKALADAMSSAALTEQLRSKFPDEKAPLERFAYAISAYLLENRWKAQRNLPHRKQRIGGNAHPLFALRSSRVPRFNHLG